MEVNNNNDKLSGLLDNDKIVSSEKYRTDSDKENKRTSYDSVDDFGRFPYDPNIFKKLHVVMSGFPCCYELYSEGFDMQNAISVTPDVSDLAKKVITGFSEERDFYLRFSYYQERKAIVEQIVKMDKKWERNDALLEAAKEYVAVKHFHQCVYILNTHRRVVYDFQTMTDEEYIELRNQLFEDGNE